MADEMTYLSCFSGIGGLDLGFDRAGLKCVGQIEIDKNARTILGRHWPEVPKHDDITTAVEWAERIGLRGGVDVVAGGAPCQDLSVAGKREGFAGERSRLVLDMVTLAKAVEARYLVYENVPGLLSANQGRDFGYLLAYLAVNGFHDVEWRTLNAQFFGVAQRRRRVFLIASAGNRRGRQILSESEGVSGNPSPRYSSRSDITTALTGGLGSGGPDAAHAAAGWLVPDTAPRLMVNAKGGLRTTDIDGAASVVTSIPVADVAGTLASGAHPSGFNGQDAYTGKLVVTRGV